MPRTSKKARARKPTNIVGSFHETAPGKTRDKPLEPVGRRRLVAMIRAALCDPLVHQGRLVGPLTFDIARRFGGGHDCVGRQGGRLAGRDRRHVWPPAETDPDDRMKPGWEAVYSDSPRPSYRCANI